MTPWRNGSASDSRSEGCVFKSRRGQLLFLVSKVDLTQVLIAVNDLTCFLVLLIFFSQTNRNFHGYW